MKQKTLKVFFIAGMALSLSFSISTGASSAVMPITIDHFVANLFPQASHYHWVVNDSKRETQRETIIDINTFITKKDGATPTENRFLLLLLDGQILAAQNIPLNANIDCGPDEEEV
ncbi:MAG: hypothetical protein OXI53_05170 [Nitrospira sp.]|nr:hypothetical protein [Nitrospira sp.]MDE0404684.1 hypothetical protein [Nitrospira sp.]MDE0487556.1 hypothetical protein [Nitrospira sp.]